METVIELRNLSVSLGGRPILKDLIGRTRGRFFLSSFSSHLHRIRQVAEVAHEVRPYLGSHEFLDRIRRHCQVMIISDTFTEFAEPIVERLGGYNLFANQFEVDAQGHIAGWKLRIRGQKARVIQGMKSAGFKVIGMGDSLNDLSLLESADYPILFRPVAALSERLPRAPTANGLDEALEIFVQILRSNGGKI